MEDCYEQVKVWLESSADADAELSSVGSKPEDQVYRIKKFLSSVAEALKCHLDFKLVLSAGGGYV